MSGTIGTTRCFNHCRADAELRSVDGTHHSHRSMRMHDSKRCPNCELDEPWKPLEHGSVRANDIGEGRCTCCRSSVAQQPDHNGSVMRRELMAGAAEQAYQPISSDRFTQACRSEQQSSSCRHSTAISVPYVPHCVLDANEGSSR